MSANENSCTVQKCYLHLGGFAAGGAGAARVGGGAGAGAGVGAGGGVCLFPPDIRRKGLAGRVLFCGWDCGGGGGAARVGAGGARPTGGAGGRVLGVPTGRGGGET